MFDILISTYNGEKYLEEQLDSIIFQTIQDWRILIRDDCSDDKTVEIISLYQNNFPSKIQVVKNNNINLGATNSFFELLRHSTSDLVMFCDQDDVWSRNKLEVMSDFYNKNIHEKQIPVLVHSACEVVDETLGVLEKETSAFNKQKCGMEKPFLWQIFQNDVTGCTVLINAAMRETVNNIDFLKHKIVQHDWFLAQIAYLCNAKFYFPGKTIKYRQHDGNAIGVKKMSLRKILQYKIRHRMTYPYYDQVEAVLHSGVTILNEYKKILTEFSELKYKCKFIRVCWHIKNRFFREGNVFLKLYQLLIC